MASALRFQPRPDWWEASALTTASPTQCSDGSRHLDKGWGGGGGNPDPEIRGEGLAPRWASSKETRLFSQAT